MTFPRFASLALLVFSFPAFAIDLDRPDVKAFIDGMVREHDYDAEALHCIFGKAETQPTIIEKISSPSEKRLNWSEYRLIFLTRERISAGADFWRENRETLDKVSADTGVPKEILVGIIGVETYFGRLTGGHRVLDALVTLAFDYPPRSKFFRSELEHFLLLVREEQMDATAALGSYAGAMGRPQFMPSSFRAYAVDSTGDGKRDIWNNWNDVAGSIANYFLRHGWRPDKEIVARATLGQNWEGPFPGNKLSAQDTVAGLSDKGVIFATDLPDDSASQLLRLEVNDGNEHWVGFHNFFVITRYNRSVMYALAVHQLGREIALEVNNDVS